jgi:hypothetical protein
LDHLTTSLICSRSVVLYARSRLSAFPRWHCNRSRYFPSRRERILQLPQTVFDDPEARLYAGLAELTIASKILLTEADGFQTLPPDEQPIIEFLIGVTAPQDAIQNFELGLAETPGAEARSLNGAFHVFEAHSAQLLVQAMASFGSPGASESSNIPSPLVSETSQQPLLTIPQPA